VRADKTINRKHARVGTESRKKDLSRPGLLNPTHPVIEKSPPLHSSESRRTCSTYALRLSKAFVPITSGTTQTYRPPEMATMLDEQHANVGPGISVFVGLKPLNTRRVLSMCVSASPRNRGCNQPPHAHTRLDFLTLTPPFYTTRRSWVTDPISYGANSRSRCATKVSHGRSHGTSGCIVVLAPIQHCFWVERLIPPGLHPAPRDTLLLPRWIYAIAVLRQGEASPPPSPHLPSRILAIPNQ
jgi:hypothetical protein